VNKSEFVDALAVRLGSDKKAAAAAVDGVIQTIYAAVAKGEKVALTGFGSFERRTRAARTARNPATGATVKVKKTNVPAFKAGAEFKQVASGAKKVAAAKAAPAKKVAAKKAAPAKKAAAKAPARKVAAKKAPAKRGR
jgi:DNA-binding protein HU-beta